MFNSLKLARHDMYTPNNIVSLSLFHYIPVVNDIASYFNNIPSDYQSIKQTIHSGHSVSIMLGGVREMMDTEPRKIKLHVKKRSGLFKISLETRKPIIPVLTYGENELFEPAKNYYTESLNDFLYTHFGISIPFVTLHSLYKWYQLSYKPIDEIHSYVGNPITPRKDDTIETLRNRYIESVKKLFRKTAPLNYTLHIQ
jgi:1-acyl-sn-glycerol-3-phosphate acyltransferase